MRIQKMNWDRVHKEDMIWREERRVDEGRALRVVRLADRRSKEAAHAPCACAVCRTSTAGRDWYFVCTDTDCRLAYEARFCSDLCARQHGRKRGHAPTPFKRVIED